MDDRIMHWQSILDAFLCFLNMKNKKSIDFFSLPDQSSYYYTINGYKKYYLYMPRWGHAPIMNALALLNDKMTIQVIVSPFIRKWESKKIEQFSCKPLIHQPVFIIGAPRTGSTILYQMNLNVSILTTYLVNFFFGFWLRKKLFCNKAHDSFNSNLGDTQGYNSPSECGIDFFLKVNILIKKI